MLDNVFFLLPLTLLIFIFILLKYIGFSLLQPNFLSVFIWFYVTFAYLGVIPLYYYWDKYRVFEGVTDRRIISEIWLYSSFSLVLIIIGYVFIGKILKIKTKNLYSKEIGNINPFSKFLLNCLLIISIGVALFYLLRLQSIPLISIFSGGVDEAKTARSLATNELSGSHWYRLFYNSLLTFISYIYFAILLKQKSRMNLMIFIVLFVVTSFVMLSTTAKAPVIFYWMGLFLVLLISKNINLNLKVISIFGILVMPVILFMYAFFMKAQEQSILELFTAALSRIFTGQVTPAYFYLYLFPEYNDFLLGKSLPNPGGIFPWEHYPLSRVVKAFMNPELVERGIVGTAPTAFWAESYANFGLGGIAVFALLVGATLAIIQFILSSKIPYNPITIGLMVFLMLDFSKLALDGVSYYIFNVHRMVIIFITIILLLINNGSKQKRVNTNKR